MEDGRASERRLGDEQAIGESRRDWGGERYDDTLLGWSAWGGHRRGHFGALDRNAKSNRWGWGGPGT